MKDHNPDNDECPCSRIDAFFGMVCTCRNPNDVGSLKGQGLLDAINEARTRGSYKGWTYKEMVNGPSVLPMAVYDNEDAAEPVVEHQCIVSMGTRQQCRSMTLMVTTPDGTTYQEFVPKGPATSIS